MCLLAWFGRISMECVQPKMVAETSGVALEILGTRNAPATAVSTEKDLVVVADLIGKVQVNSQGSLIY